MDLQILFSLILWASAFLISLAGTFLALRHFNDSPPHMDAPFALYPISILKPLKGADHDLEKNLEAFFCLDYPHFELIFSVADEHDPSVKTVEALIRKYPAIPTRFIRGAQDIGPNPKVNNLIRSYADARYDWLLISDSNVKVGSDYLKRMIAHLDPNTGLITAIIGGQNGLGLGGLLEAVYLNTFYAKAMCLAATFAQPCAVGKSMLFQKSQLEKMGGLEAFGKFLAEDLMIGEAIQKNGQKIILMTDPVLQNIGKHSLKDFWARHMRWGRIRKSHAPLAFFAELFSNVFISGALGMFALRKGFDIKPAAFLAFHFSIWSICDFLVMRKLDPKPGLLVPLIWFLRELLAIPLWLGIASGRTIHWRGQRFYLKSKGLLETLAR